MTTEQIETARAYQRKYEATPKGKATQQRYNDGRSQAGYYQNRSAKHRAMAIGYLGGACAGCGATDNLKFSYIDPKTKSFTIGGRLTAAWKTLMIELDKCELLCRTCCIVKVRDEKEKR